jgi:hypothetical protein
MQGCTIYLKRNSHRKILGVLWVTWSKFRTEGPQILGATVQNLVARGDLAPRICASLI